jgi:hypothetical protein
VLAEGLKWDWESFPDFLEIFDRSGQRVGTILRAPVIGALIAAAFRARFARIAKRSSPLRGKVLVDPGLGEGRTA